MSDSPEQLATTVQDLSLTDTASFHLICSDGERVAVDPALLSAYSTIWRDTLDIGEGGRKSGECHVTEKGFTLLETGDASKLLERDLVELGLKYDSWAVRETAKGAIWSMLDREPLRAYSLASRLDDTSLLEQAAKNTLSPNKLSWTMYGGDQTSTEAKVRLERYHLAHIEAARACLTFPVLGKNCHCTYRYSDRRNYSDSDKGIWEECLLACYKNLKANSVPHEMMRDEVNGRGGRWADCPSCATRLSSKIAEVRRAWEESGRGKHYINL